MDHGYDDLSALAQCTDGEVDDLVRLFTTPDSKSAIADMVHALKQIGIGEQKEGQRTDGRHTADPHARSDGSDEDRWRLTALRPASWLSLWSDVYRKQKGEFRRLIELNDRAKKQNDISEQVSRVRGESLAIKVGTAAKRIEINRLHRLHKVAAEVACGGGKSTLQLLTRSDSSH